MSRALALVFTQGVSVEQWAAQGLLERERLPYQRLVKRGVGVLWFTYGAGDKRYEAELRGIEIVPMPRLFDSRLGRLAYSLLLPWVRAREFRRADTVKTNQMKGAWSAVLAARRHGKRLVVRTGYTWSLFPPAGLLDRLAPLVERWACAAADEVQVTTESQRAYLIARHRLAPARVRVIPNFVDTARFSPAPALARRDDRVIFIGRLSAQKNLETLLAALAGTGLGLDLYGDGPLRERLEARAAALGVPASFHGRVSNAELPAILNRHAVFVLPSLYEGFPKALLEAMACGLAVVAADAPGNRELVEHGRTGLLAAPTSGGLRAALISLQADAALRGRLGQAAATEASGRFSLESVAALEAHAR
ncbi:MAG: glycosyltransferase family 4 protein [Elusimicrobia bacterium]|nr:glycosyltransferase family 4 protein [Elusimicrobiota bacterium]